MSDIILNTKGAASKLGCGESWIHKLVYRGKLQAYAYNSAGVLEARPAQAPRQGQGLYFYEKDLEAYQPEVQRRPRGSKDKVKNNPKRRGNVKTSSEESI